MEDITSYVEDISYQEEDITLYVEDISYQEEEDIMPFKVLDIFSRRKSSQHHRTVTGFVTLFERGSLNLTGRCVRPEPTSAQPHSAHRCALECAQPVYASSGGALEALFAPARLHSRAYNTDRVSHAQFSYLYDNADGVKQGHDEEEPPAEPPPPLPVVKPREKQRCVRLARVNTELCAGKSGAPASDATTLRNCKWKMTFLRRLRCVQSREELEGSEDHYNIYIYIYIYIYIVYTVLCLHSRRGVGYIDRSAGPICITTGYSIYTL